LLQLRESSGEGGAPACTDTIEPIEADSATVGTSAAPPFRSRPASGFGTAFTCGIVEGSASTITLMCPPIRR
jgi:hypothetical protein